MELEQLQEIIKKMKFICVQEGLTGVSPDTFLECSTRIFNSQDIDKSKKENIKQMKESKPFKEDLLTPKQRYTLNKLGISFDDNTTKQQASKLITKAQQEQNY